MIRRARFVAVFVRIKFIVIPVLLPFYSLVEFIDNLLDWLYLAKICERVKQGIDYLEQFKDAIDEVQNSGQIEFVSVKAKSKGHGVTVKIKTL